MSVAGGLRGEDAPVLTALSVCVAGSSSSSSRPRWREEEEGERKSTRPDR